MRASSCTSDSPTSTPSHLDMVLNTGIEVVSNQVSFSLLDGRAAGAMTEVCRKHGVHLLAYGTLAGGLLTERWLGAADPGPEGVKTWSEMKYRRFVEAAGGWDRLQPLLAAIRAVADRDTGCRWRTSRRAPILDRPAVAGVIIGARLGRREHIADNLRLASLRDWTRTIGNVLAAARRRAGPHPRGLR